MSYESLSQRRLNKRVGGGGGGLANKSGRLENFGEKSKEHALLGNRE